MAMDIAKKLVEELLANEAKRNEFLEDPAAFLSAGGYDCTLAEIKEQYDTNHEMDDEELQRLNGGGCSFFLNGSPGRGGCRQNYFEEECAATVENRSWCGTNDWCEVSQVVYHKPKRH